MDIDNKENVTQYSTNVRKALFIVLLLNLFVVLIKIFVGIVTRSISILGDAAHSAVDTTNNIVGLVILKFASEPPDKKHPYGHGKFETLAAFGIITFLAVACLEIVQSSVHRLIHPVKLPLFKTEMVFLLALTLIVNLIVWFYERGRGKQLRSDLLVADSSHTGSDVLITSSILASQYFIARGMYWIDPIIALIIGGFIIKAGFEIIINTVPILVDEAWVDPKTIVKSALSVNGVVDCYDVFSRRGPYSSFIECKIKVVPKDLYTAHQLADEVEEKLKADFGNCKVTVHVEP